MSNGIAIAALLGLDGAASAQASGAENENEGAAASTAMVSAAEAIAAAEKATGGRAVKLDIESENGAYLYEIRTATQDKVKNAFVDPATGKIVPTEDKGLIASVFEGEDWGALAKLQGFKTTLATAVATVEQQAGGKTLEAEYGDEDDKPISEAKVVKDSVTPRVEIDAASGKVTKVSGATHEKIGSK